MSGKTGVLSVTLPPLHPGQREVAQSPGRFKVLAAGRRWGKTRLASALSVAKALEGKVVWWVAPSFPLASIGWRELKALARQIPGSEVKTAERLILVPTRPLGWVQIKSADNPDSLRGEGLDLLIFDECAVALREAWYEALRPALADKKGEALFISTPKGKNWFYELYLRGKDESQEEYRSFRYRTIDNPFIDPKEVLEAERSLPQDVFKQEFEAEFLEDAAGVFRNVHQCLKGDLEPPIEGHFYVIGWDPAKHQDFSVMAVMDVERRHLVCLERLQRVEYEFQLHVLESLSKKYNDATVLMDSTGPGDPILEQARARGLSVEGYHFSALGKRHLIEALAVALEREEVSFPPVAPLLRELSLFEYTLTKTGSLKYQAPEGYTDDCVMALALAYWACRRQGAWVL